MKLGLRERSTAARVFWERSTPPKIWRKRSLLHTGKGGIRTLGDGKATPIFKIGAIDHSATFPFYTGHVLKKKIRNKKGHIRRPLKKGIFEGL